MGCVSVSHITDDKFVIVYGPNVTCAVYIEHGDGNWNVF